MKKRIVSFILAVLLICTLLPTAAFAADIVASGTCGANLIWTLDSEGTLTISGTGAMTDYSNGSSVPWYSSRSSIKSVTIPDSVTSIGNYAFNNCSSLASVTIPDGVTSIGDHAFEGCSSLASVTIPDSVTSIGGSVFYGCSSLASVTIPNSVTSIGDYAFYYCSSLASVTIPDSVTSIGSSAFYGCSSLASVSILAELTSIRSYTFSGCSGLESINIPDSVTSIGAGAFNTCRSLTDIELPSSLTEIDAVAFGGCSKLEQITIPSGVTLIGFRAFADCYGLKSVSIPASVTDIGNGAFADCRSLATIDLAENNPNYCIFNRALYDKDRTCLLRKEVDQYTSSYEIPEGVTSIEAYAFSGDNESIHISIPDSVTSIGSHAFSNCRNLYNLDIPDSVKSIGGELFSGCTALTKVTFPNGIEAIGDYMFYGCSSLKEVKIPDSVTRIGMGAFWDCRNLTSINIPAAVKTIYDFTFYGCNSLTDVYYNGPERKWNQLDIPYIHGNESLRYANIHFNPYNLGEETYSFRNFGDKHSKAGHCFGMSMTSSAYYMGILEESQVGAVNGNIYDLGKTNKVKEPICYYQQIQGSKANAAIVAGGSCFFSSTKNDISSDWAEVINYVKDHNFDDEGTLQVVLVSWKNKNRAHAVNFLNYSVVNGQERIYVYDNNFPDTETYLYKGSDGKVYQSPRATFPDGIAGVDLRSVEKYFSAVGNYLDSSDRAMQEEYLSHAIYAEKGTISVSGATEYLFIAGDTESEYVVFEIPEGCETATITPHVDNATFTYLDEEYSFGKINDETRGEFKLSDSAEENNASLTIQNEGTYENPFVDVAEDAVYYDAVLWAYYHEPEQITSGFDAKHFGPQNACTRAQVVTFLWRAAGCPEPTGDTSMFCDTSSIAAPYQKAVVWAVEKGITTGFADGTFRPNDSVTRAQFVTFLWRYEGKPATSGSIAGFTDASSIAEPYQQAVAWAVEKGITTGYGDDTFRPNATCTRWAVVLFMYRDMK